MHGDSASIRGKYLTTLVASSGGGVSIAATFTPFGLGSRPAGFASLFTHYRFKEIVIRIFCGSSPLNLITMGVLDDASGSEGENPPNYQAVAALRTSSVVPCTGQPFIRVWKPLDPKMWYNSGSGSTGSDQRLVTAGVLFVGYPAAATGQVVDIEIDYSIAFKGAYTTSAAGLHEAGYQIVNPGSVVQYTQRDGHVPLTPQFVTRAPTR